MDKIKTGISGLDEMLRGGIPKGKHVAIYGGPGTGKSSFCLEFLYRGAKANEHGLYLSLEETGDEMVDNMANTFSKLEDLREMVNSKKIKIIKPDNIKVEEMADIVEDEVNKRGVSRVVIDSATMIKLTFDNQLDYRQTLFEFLSFVSNLDCTLIMTLESSSPRKENIVFDVEHYAMDGIINLYNLDQGDARVRALEIFKMRGTEHSQEIVPFKVTPEGMKVYVGERVF